MVTETENDKKILIGISSCLLGNPVRYDGQHKLDRYIVDILGQYVNFLAICPEADCGLSVPRESMRLVDVNGTVRLLTNKTKTDMTDKMINWGRMRIAELENEPICGFIFKSKSPSSGMERVKVYPEKGGVPRNSGTGIFAGLFIEHFPNIPVEEEGRLNDPALRENFIDRIFAYSRWREMLENNRTAKGLLEFHQRHKLMLMAHSPSHYRTAGKLTSNLKVPDFHKLLHEYISNFMAGLKLRATVKKNFNVLQHILGYFKKQLTREEKAEVMKVLEEYKRELVPLIVPVTLLKFFINKYNEKYLIDQYYLTPFPSELKLRNHA